MKLLYVLPVLMALPMGAYARSSFNSVKPFIGYDIRLGGAQNLKVKDDAGNVVTSNQFLLNDDNIGNFIIGVEFGNVGSVSLHPTLRSTQIKTRDARTETEKMDEIDVEFNIYLIQESNFKPYVLARIGYTHMHEMVKTYGAVFGAGLGFRQYLTNNFFLNGAVEYNTTQEMTVHELNGAKVDDVSMRISGFNFNIGGGYRF